MPAPDRLHSADAIVIMRFRRRLPSMRTTTTPTLAALILLAVCTPSAASKPERLWALTTDSDAGCEFSVVHRGLGKALTFRSEFDPCDSVLSIDLHRVSDVIAIVDAPQERGGSAYVLHRTNQEIHRLMVDYVGTDEDGLDSKLVGKQLILSTTLEEIRISIRDNGTLALERRIRK
jgi:hypothetical protein